MYKNYDFNSNIVIIGHANSLGLYEESKIIVWKEIYEKISPFSNINLISCYSKNLETYGHKQNIPLFSGLVDQIVAFYAMISTLPQIIKSIEIKGIEAFTNKYLPIDKIAPRIMNPINTLSGDDTHHIDAIVAVDQYVKNYMIYEYDENCVPFGDMCELNYGATDWESYLLFKMDTWDDALERTFNIKFNFKVVFDFYDDYDENNLIIHPNIGSLNCLSEQLLRGATYEDATYYTVGYEADDTKEKMLQALTIHNDGIPWLKRSDDINAKTNKYAVVITLIGYLREMNGAIHGNWADGEYKNMIFMQIDHPFWRRETTFSHEISHLFGADHVVKEVLNYPGGQIDLNDDVSVPDGNGPAIETNTNPFFLSAQYNYEPYDITNWYKNENDDYPAGYGSEFSVMNYFHAFSLGRIFPGIGVVFGRLGLTIFGDIYLPVVWDWFNDYLIRLNIERFDYFDSDGDGLSNGYEDFLLLDKYNNDSDGDGMYDGYENEFGLDNYNDDASLDPDGDLLTNAQEFLAGTDPLKADSDNDGIDDLFETHYYFSDPWKIDSDSDGLTDYEEIHEEFTLVNNPDSDGDGMLDGWEVEYGLNPLDDTDSDSDPDNDGLSNYYEHLLREYSYNPRSNNSDNLGLLDGEEDPDGDNLDNIGEQNAGTYPHVKDTDFDQLPDGWEVHNFLNPLDDDSDSDPDNDGLSNLQEYNGGVGSTDPLVDEQPPTVSITSHSNGQYVSGSETIVYSAYDAYATPQVSLYIDGNIVIPFTTTWETGGVADGPHTLQMVAVDNNGKMTYGNIITVIVDNTAPTATQSHYNGDWVSGTVTISFNPSDALSGLGGISTISVDGTVYGGISHSWDTSALEDGIYLIEFATFDNALNVLTISYVITVDNSIPTVTSISHYDWDIVYGSTVLSFAASGGNSYRISIDGIVVSSTSSYDWTSFADGDHVIAFRVMDNRHPDGVATITLRANAYVPVVSVSATYDYSFGIYAAGNIYITVTATDGNGIGNVYIKIDGYIYCNDFTYPYSCTVDLSALADGTLTVEAMAFDGLGSYAIDSFEIRSDNTAPTGYVYLYSNPSNYVAGSGRDFYTAGLYDWIGIDYVKFYVDGVHVDTDGSGSYTLDDLNSYAYNDGVHEMRADFYDYLGNMRSSSINFVIDNDNPWASISGITNGAYYTRFTTQTVYVTAYDIGTGVNKIEIYVNGYLKKQSYSTSTSHSIIMPYSGSLTVLVKIYDNAGRVRSYTYTINVASGGGGGGPM